MLELETRVTNVLCCKSVHQQTVLPPANVAVGVVHEPAGNYTLSSDILGKVPKFRIFGNVWERLGTFGNYWELLGTFGNGYLGDISASEQTVTVLRHVILATEQGSSRADVH